MLSFLGRHCWASVLPLIPNGHSCTALIGTLEWMIQTSVQSLPSSLTLKCCHGQPTFTLPCRQPAAPTMMASCRSLPTLLPGHTKDIVAQRSLSPSPLFTQPPRTHVGELRERANAPLTCDWITGQDCQFINCPKSTGYVHSSPSHSPCASTLARN